MPRQRRCRSAAGEEPSSMRLGGARGTRPQRGPLGPGPSGLASTGPKQRRCTAFRYWSQEANASVSGDRADDVTAGAAERVDAEAAQDEHVGERTVHDLLQLRVRGGAV